MDREIDSTFLRRRRIRRLAGGLVVLVVGAGLIVLAADWLRPSVKRARTRVGLVERGDLEATLTASGTVVPAYERVISSPVDARVERVLFTPGDVVERGSAILELDTAEIRLRLEGLEDQLAQNHNERLQKRLELEETVAALESRIETGRLDLEIARFRLDQKSRLWDDGLVSEETLKEAQVAVKKAEIDLARMTEEIVAQRRLNEARLERLELDARILRNERDEVKRQVELATTSAPVAGVLTSVIREEGTAVHQGDVLARIADLQSFRVEAKVSDAYASRLAVGQDVYVLVDDERLTGTVAQILPTIEQGTAMFNVDLNDPADTHLRHNLRVDVLVVTGRRSDVLKAPRGPYLRGGGQRYPVFVIDDDRARRTEVTVGLVGHDYVEVVDGLAEGDEIILSDMTNYEHAAEIRLR